MRNQTSNQAEQITRLLLQKPAACAELEENSRIAISVLTDDGWKVTRIGLDLHVKVTSSALIEEQNAADQVNAKLVAHLADAELRFVELRKRVLEVCTEQWLAMTMAFLVAAALQWIGAGRWIGIMAPVCLAGYVIAQRINRKKGAA